MSQPVQGRAEPSREELEEQAEQVRERLASDIDELKRRGRRVVESVSSVRTKVKEHPGIAIGVAAGTLVVLGLVWRARRARHRRDLRREVLLGIAARLLGPAYVVKAPEAKPSPVKNAFAQASKELVLSAGREIGRRALLAMTDGMVEQPAEEAQRPA